MICTKPLLASIAAAVVALSAAGPASADAFITMTRAGNFPFAGPGGGLVPLAGGGVVSTPNFVNLAGQRFQVLYTAECSVYATASLATWMNIDIELVNVGTGAVTVLAPTIGASDALCTGNGSAADDGWTMAAVNAVSPAGLQPGTYRIQIRGRIQNGAGNGHLGDSSLTVWR